MIRNLLLAVALSLGAASSAQALSEMPSRELPMRDTPAMSFRAPDLRASRAVMLAEMSEKSAAATAVLPAGRLRVATVRALAKSQSIDEWSSIAGGFVTRIDASSTGAEGLRTRLDVSTLTLPMEVRVQGADGRIEFMTVQPGAPEAWTPWTEGEAQSIELFSAAPQDVKVAAMLHFTLSPYAKAAATCTVPVACSTNDTALDAAIAQRKKSIMRIQFVEGASGFVCSATLINTEKFPAGYVVTANHCINNPTSAASITSLWFYENSACDVASTVAPGQSQVAGGMQLVFTNANVDSTLLLMGGTPPAGAVYSAWSAAHMASPGTAVTSLSHPQGDTARLALGTTDQEFRIVGHPQDMYGVRFTRGIIQGGSSGSGLFTLAAGNLQFRGVLSGTTVRQGGMSCTNTDEDGLYGRFDLFEPQIDQYISATTRAPDDAPNRPFDLAPPDLAGADLPLNQRSAPISLDGRRIDYAGDLDIFRFILTAPATVTAWSEGANLDTVGSILDANGVELESNDDAQAADNHFGITRYLTPGTYFVQVGHFDATGTGAYNLRIRADSVEETNHTALWWNASESGWGLNVNHQGNKIFATLFTYDSAGPMWLVMSEGTRQSDGSYSGTLYRTTGPAFNATPFSGVSVANVGTMRIAFSGNDSASLTYTFNGTQVTKSLTRQAFATLPTCKWSAFDRSYADNFQDLWYNANESGWGLNVTHQSSKIFATLFTYDTTGRGLWLVMSEGALNSTTGAFSGPLYRTSGPAFNASPWVAATATQVGTMTFTPSNGNSAALTYTFNGVTVTKQIQRQTFATLRPECE